MNQAAAIQDNLELARRLVDAIESGDRSGTDDLIRALNDGRFDALFREIGKLTRELHDTFGSLAADERLVSLAHHAMPDARARLQYVIEKTEDAADRTLSAVETMLPLTDELVEEADRLREALASEADTTVLRTRMAEFLDRVNGDGRHLRRGLNDVLMAQEFQDLTGQVIKRTIDLVAQVEEKLVDLVSACGEVTRLNAAPVCVNAATSHGPAVQRQENVVSRQADVDELLANLGF